MIKSDWLAVCNKFPMPLKVNAERGKELRMILEK